MPARLNRSYVSSDSAPVSPNTNPEKIPNASGLSCAFARARKRYLAVKSPLSTRPTGSSANGRRLTALSAEVITMRTPLPRRKSA